VAEKVLITGGAGFIGSHLADTLLAEGHEVTLYDNLHPQVHGVERSPPEYLNRKVELVRGDVRDLESLGQVLQSKSVVYHFAAYTGVGQSMYRIQEYQDVNVTGTAALLELLSQRSAPKPKLILASSRAVYGEGAYHCAGCGLVHPEPRGVDQLRQGAWEVTCPICRQPLTPRPTPEELDPKPASVYAVGKYNQEQTALIVSQAYSFPLVILRFFNVYGPRQSLRNPYTGVLGTFITRLMMGKPVQIYEDGQESRDFVYISDIVEACLLAMNRSGVNGQIINVGSGQVLTIQEIAETVTTFFDGPQPIITGQYRVGDIRHCYADIARARKLLDYEPAVSFTEGVGWLVGSLAGQTWADLSRMAEEELEKRGLAPHLDRSI
jgi:dTDP-L-rhamnose 4-epimerase